MTAQYLVLLVEEPSMEAFLRVLLPRVLPAGCGFEVHSFRGKSNLLKNLESRLRGYAQWLPENWRIVVMVDRDRDDCRELKDKIEAASAAAGLRTRSRAGGARWQVANRIVIEELEAWYFGDWQAVQSAYPRISRSVPGRTRYRNPDAVPGTWEAFERILKAKRYFATGLRKIEAARAVAAHIEPRRNRSGSFNSFFAAVVEASLPVETDRFCRSPNGLKT